RNGDLLDCRYVDGDAVHDLSEDGWSGSAQGRDPARSQPGRRPSSVEYRAVHHLGREVHRPGRWRCQHGWRLGSYAAPVKVTDDLLWRGGASAGLGSDINPLTDAVAMNIRDGVEKWVKVVNVDLYAATGSANTLTGFSSAVAPSGIYANINQSTQSGWASTVQ